MKTSLFGTFLIIMFCLSGCSSKDSEIKIERVEVPVYSCPIIDIPERPILALERISKASKDAEVMKAYGRTVDQLLNYSDVLIGVIKKQNELSDEKYSKEH